MSASASAPVVACKPSIRIDAPEVVERWWKNVRAAWPETEGSYFEVVGFAALEKPTDAIARQSVFQATVRCFLTKAATASGARRISLVERLFEFLLQPEYAAYHRRYAEWRATMLTKCDEFCADFLCSRRLRGLCRRFQRLFPDPEPEPFEDYDPQGNDPQGNDPQGNDPQGNDPEPVDCY